MGGEYGSSSRQGQLPTHAPKMQNNRPLLYEQIEFENDNIYAMGVQKPVPLKQYLNAPLRPPAGP